MLTSSNVKCNKLFFAKKSYKRNTTFLEVYQKFWIALSQNIMVILAKYKI